VRPLLFALDSAHGLAERLCGHLEADRGHIERRQFPDGESYVRLASEVDGRDIVLLCSLNEPDEKTLPLLFTAEAARAQGARSVGLTAPYLAYMRQDKAFRPGEAVTSLTFARLLGERFDWLATLDPHLHRYPSVDRLY
jgi:ribose-phosphate pyrophosphokinase